jgi:two-component system KDP operon response regulator KdpE
MPAALLVESDESVTETLLTALRGTAETVLHAPDGLEALRLFYENRVELALIGFPVQKFDGVELVRLFRNLSGLPILVLAASPNSSLTVRLLEAGADDVMPVQVSLEELLARIRATSRRASRDTAAVEAQAVVRTGDLVIDRSRHLVTKAGRPVALSQTEYRLLDALASHVGRVAPHRFLLSTVWGDAFVDDTHYLRMYIGYLRAKLEDDPSQPNYLRNEWGAGYRLALLPVTSIEGAPAGAHLEVVTEAMSARHDAPSEAVEDVASRE